MPCPHGNTRCTSCKHVQKLAYFSGGLVCRVCDVNDAAGFIWQDVKTAPYCRYYERAGIE